MSERIIKNFSSLLLANIFYKACTFLSMIILVRFLGPVGFGKFSYVLSILWIILFIADFGINEYLIRKCSGNKDAVSNYFSIALPLKVSLLILSYSLIAITAFVNYLDEVTFFLFFLLGIHVLVDSLTGYFRIIFRIEEKMHKEAFLFSIEGILKLLLVGSFIQIYNTNTSKEFYIAFAFIASSFISLTLAFLFSRKSLPRLSFNVSWSAFKSIRKESTPLALLYFLGLMNFRVDNLMLGYLSNDTAVGLYSTAWRLLEQLFIFPILV